MSKIPTTAELLKDKTQFGTYGNMYKREDVSKKMIKFAKLHVEAALKEVSKNISLKESSSNEINNNNIFPFITADDNTVWIINNDSILNAYPLENVK